MKYIITENKEVTLREFCDRHKLDIKLEQEWTEHSGMGWRSGFEPTVTVLNGGELGAAFGGGERVATDTAHLGGQLGALWQLCRFISTKTLRIRGVIYHAPVVVLGPTKENGLP